MIAMATHGRPWEVLEFIDRCEDPTRPLVVDLASRSARVAALPHIKIALHAGMVRYEDAKQQVDILQRIVGPMEERLASGSER